MICGLFGCSVVPIGEYSFMILGGSNSSQGESKKVYNLNVLDGTIKILEDLPCGGWSSMNTIYHNNSVHMFFTGEENGNKLPDHVQYFFDLN